MKFVFALVAVAQVVAAAKAKADAKECEIDELIDKDDKASKVAIAEAITRHCGDLQNEKPNPALSQKDRKMCYYFEPIKPFSTRMPKDRVCKRLKKENPEICEVKYPVKVEKGAGVSDEEFMAKIKKMRVKELKGILADRGVACDGCLEKDDFIKKILDTQDQAGEF